MHIEKNSPGRTQSFDEVKEALGTRLQQEREKELVQKIRKDLRAGLNININDIILKTTSAKNADEIAQSDISKSDDQDLSLADMVIEDFKEVNLEIIESLFN